MRRSRSAPARSGATAADVAAVPPSLLPYAQFCDAPAERPDPQDFNAVIIDAIDLRMQLGEGRLPLHAVLRALPRDIPLAIELRSKALREAYPDACERGVGHRAGDSYLAARGRGAAVMRSESKSVEFDVPDWICAREALRGILDHVVEARQRRDALRKVRSCARSARLHRP